MPPRAYRRGKAFNCFIHVSYMDPQSCKYNFVFLQLLKSREERPNHKDKSRSQRDLVSKKQSTEELHSEISSSEDEILTRGICNNDESSQQSRINGESSDELSRIEVIPSLTFNKGSEDSHKSTPLQVRLFVVCSAWYFKIRIIQYI